MKRPLFLTFPILIMLVLAACTGAAEAQPPPNLPGTTPSGPGSEAAGEGSTSNGLFDGLATDHYLDTGGPQGIARVVVEATSLPVHDAPDGQVIGSVSSATSFGTTRVLLVEERTEGWLRVRLPARPNHQSGWIPSSSVRLEVLSLEVVVDRSERTLTVKADEEILLVSPIAVGTEENPTPLGTFYITDKLETPDPDGAYGPFALGLSGYSETLTEFAGGDGQLGIHGTDDPASIGQAASHGCIRIPNELISQLATMLPLGTPIHII